MLPMKKKILSTIVSLLLVLSASAQCFYETLPDPNGNSYNSRKTKIYDKKRTQVTEAYIYFEKHLSNRNQTSSVTYGIVVRIHGYLGAHGISILELTYEDDTEVSLYIPSVYDKRILGDYMSYETAGMFKSDSPELSALKVKRIKEAKLINEDDKYIPVKIPADYFIEAFNCVRDLN